MSRFREKGFVLFCVILLLVLFSSLVAYQISGHKGIEERFQHAVGLSGEEEEEGGNFFGFCLEGNTLLYLVILGILGICSLVAYRSYHL